MLVLRIAYCVKREACFVPVIGVTGYQAVIIRVSGYQVDPFFLFEY